MQAAGPPPSYAVPIPLAIGNPSNFSNVPTRGPMAPALQGTTSNSPLLNAGSRPPETSPLLPGAPGPLSVQIALQYAGAPYEYGGQAPDGFDCSGFVYYVLSRAGRTVPRDLAGQYSAGPHPQGPLQSGDLVFFQDTYEYGLSHVGIYMGGGQFIHALDEARGVAVSSLDEAFYSTHWYGATRLP
jgi:cell wall-associated NlpC family hydrolase